MSYFDVKNKVAIVTGGASGIGLCCAKELLKNGLKGVTIADSNEQRGNNASKELSARFSAAKVLFVETDVTDFKSFERAFNLTAEKFGHIDILINGAGLCDDSKWEKEIAVNVNGTINGILLGLENYMPKFKTDNEGVIINVSSIRGVFPGSDRPIYTATKFAVHGMSLAWGATDHYDRTKIKVVAVCPGVTLTPMTGQPDTNLGEAYEEIRRKNATHCKLPTQTPEDCAKTIIEVLRTAKTGTVWIAEAGEKYQYVMPSRFPMKGDNAVTAAQQALFQIGS